MKSDTSWEEGVLRQIIGEELGSVEFVRDYVQLRFLDSILTAVTHPTVRFGSRAYEWDQDGYRDELCRRIGVPLAKVRILPGEAVELEFRDGATVSVSLKADSYVGAEAIHFQAADKTWWAL